MVADTPITNDYLLSLIYGAYCGCLISHPCDHVPFQYRGVKMVDGFLHPVLYGDWSGGTNPNLSCDSHTDWDDIKLMLKRPENISDEHALELCELAGYGGTHTVAIGKQLITEYTRKVSNVVGVDWFKVLDFLRRNAYDCGYDDIPSLIDAGVAIETQETFTPYKLRKQ